MAKYFFLVVFLMVSCGKHKSHEMTASDRILAKYEFYKSKITEESYVDRCDKLTFKALESAYGVRQNVEEHEIEPGKFIRDRRDTSPCYSETQGDMGSKSSISFDPYLTLLHHSLTYRDLDLVRRIRSYGELHSWVMGEGLQERVYMPHLKFFVDLVASKLEGTVKVTGSEDALPNYFGGFRAHLGALAVDLMGRCEGGIGSVKIAYLEKLHAENKESALIQKIYSKWVTGDFSKVESILDDENTFPPDKLPANENLWWGPSIVMFIASVGI